MKILKTILLTAVLSFVLINTNLPAIEKEFTIFCILFIASIILCLSILMVLGDIENAVHLLIHTIIFILVLCVFLFSYRAINDKFFLPSIEELQIMRDLFIKRQKLSR